MTTRKKQSLFSFFHSLGAPLFIVGIVLINSFISEPTFAANPAPTPAISCYGHYFNEETNRSAQVILRPQGFDPNYLEAKFEGFTFAALVDEIAKGEIILLISETASNRAAMGSVGFAPLPDATKYATQKLIILHPSGRQTTLEASCYLPKSKSIVEDSLRALAWERFQRAGMRRLSLGH